MSQKNSEVKSGHVTLETCIYTGIMKLSLAPGDRASYCTKQFDIPDQIHQGLDCKNCPDFKAYEYDWSAI